MSWQIVETATHADTLLELFAKDGVFMIRANGLELMNGFSHESETAFGRLAAELAPHDAPRILIGGLGLGYTLAAVVEAVGADARITVAEFSPAVIGWFHRHVRGSVLPALPPRVSIRETDILALLREPQLYNLILLDVDNGPEAMVRAGNGALYEAEGLRLLRANLAPGGSALLWSGFESAAFEARAKAAGFGVTRRVVANGARAELDHHIYVLRAA